MRLVRSGTNDKRAGREHILSFTYFYRSCTGPGSFASRTGARCPDCNGLGWRGLGLSIGAGCAPTDQPLHIVAAAAASPPNAASAPARETASNHVEGYVATRSATGTETHTPLLATPQSISVMTRDQMKAQDATSQDAQAALTAGGACRLSPHL
jgi:hypothetical protein